ncbi:MAG: hypothetical protein ACTSVU_09560 [Promethearchaeota archaeon]
MGTQTIRNLLQTLKRYGSVSIIGMQKNAGKTTTLNALIDSARSNTILGLTSIGRDGESIDVVTSTPKPRIYVERGTLVATAKQCLYNGDITKEILKTTGIPTPMGEIIITRALSDGYIELAGPSQTAQLTQICKEMEELGAELVLVDGALNRKSFASPSITNATILATGASVSPNMDKTINLTVHTIRLLTWTHVSDPQILKWFEGIDRVGIVSNNGYVCNLPVLTALAAANEIINYLETFNSILSSSPSIQSTPLMSDIPKYVLIKGVLGDNLLEEIMQKTDKYQGITFIAENGTKLFLSQETLEKFLKTGGNLEILHPIRICAVTINPWSPEGYTYPPDKFLSKLHDAIQDQIPELKDLPIINLKS